MDSLHSIINQLSLLLVSKDMKPFFEGMVLSWLTFGVAAAMTANILTVILNRSNLQTLKRVCDLVPSPALRKQLKKLLGDQAAHVAELEADGRHKAAKWIALATWILCAWYLLKSPFSSLLKAAKRVVG